MSEPFPHFRLECFSTDLSRYARGGNTLCDWGRLCSQRLTPLSVYLVVHFRAKCPTSCDSPRFTSTSPWWSVSWSSAASTRSRPCSPMLTQTLWVTHPAAVSVRLMLCVCVCICCAERVLILWTIHGAFFHTHTFRQNTAMETPYSCLTSLTYFSAYLSFLSQNPCPEATAGFLSTITFWWFTRWVHTSLHPLHTHFVVCMMIEIRI